MSRCTHGPKEEKRVWCKAPNEKSHYRQVGLRFQSSFSLIDINCRVCVPKVCDPRRNKIQEKSVVLNWRTRACLQNAKKKIMIKTHYLTTTTLINRRIIALGQKAFRVLPHVCSRRQFSIKSLKYSSLSKCSTRF